jgi:hypothetical protein
MEQNLMNAYAEVLKNESQVCFWVDDFFFVIEDHSEGGFNVDVHTNNYGGFYSGDNLELTFLDGGHCESTKGIDAIDFMLWKVEG